MDTYWSTLAWSLSTWSQSNMCMSFLHAAESLQLQFFVLTIRRLFSCIETSSPSIVYVSSLFPVGPVVLCPSAEHHHEVQLETHGIHDDHFNGGPFFDIGCLKLVVPRFCFCLSTIPGACHPSSETTA